ncbi:MAG: ATP-dependent sacrificial sulfur transferase LarE [Anaerovoracaceae bacterium]|jgi:uncharacterized protein
MLAGIEMDLLYKKYETLKEYLGSLRNLAVAFSGGVDSTFLLKVAHEVLGEDVVAITARSISFPKRELDEAVAFALANDIKHIIFDSGEFNIEGFSQNPLNRCYLCKKEIFSMMSDIAKAHGLKYIAEASNMDDNKDYRPGHKAIAELGIKSPLREAGLSKSEIRRLSKKLGLPTWDKPSFACLYSRFSYGEELTQEKLNMVGEAEQFLIDSGFHQVRVRYHGDVARIEITKEDFRPFLEESMRKKINDKLRDLGFTYVALDLIGYRTGSMNETLNL